jgi:microcin C transport system permease protein
MLTLGGEVDRQRQALGAELQGELYFPAFKRYTEQQFGGQLPFQADYRSDYVQADQAGRRLDAVPADPVQRRHAQLRPDPPGPEPAVGGELAGHRRPGARRAGAGDLRHAGVDAVCPGPDRDQRIIGIAAGALQGYYGGWVDLLGQRLLEVWSGLPVLYLLIILSGFVEPNFWWLLGIMALFSWLALVDVVRAEFLRGRNLEYVKAARALGLGDGKMMRRHILPNAMTATLTYLPFILTGAISTFTALDFLGFGMPAGSARWAS